MYLLKYPELETVYKSLKHRMMQIKVNNKINGNHPKASDKPSLMNRATALFSFNLSPFTKR